MIRFEHNGSQISCQKACWKGYDGAETPRWNFEIEPFVAHWVVQKEEDTCMLVAVENHKPFWGVVEKGKCCYQLVLKLHEGKDINQP